MAKKDNRKCIVCSQSYYYCSNNCNDSANKPAWYAIFHDENCHDIYNAVANILPQEGKEAAKEALDKCDLSNKENFHPNIIKSINEIYDIVEETVEQDNAEVKTEDKENKAKEAKVGNVVKDTVKNTTSSTSTKEIVKEASKTVVNKTVNEAEKKAVIKDNKVIKK